MSKISAVLDVGLEITDCPSCGVQFAMPARLLQERRDTREAFWCPNGHRLSFKETTADRLRKQLAEEKARAEREIASLTTHAFEESDKRAAAERSNVALRGANTKLRKQIGGEG